MIVNSNTVNPRCLSLKIILKQAFSLQPDEASAMTGRINTKDECRSPNTEPAHDDIYSASSQWTSSGRILCLSCLARQWTNRVCVCVMTGWGGQYLHYFCLLPFLLGVLSERALRPLTPKSGRNIAAVSLASINKPSAPRTFYTINQHSANHFWWSRRIQVLSTSFRRHSNLQIPRSQTKPLTFRSPNAQWALHRISSQPCVCGGVCFFVFF